MDYAQIKQHCSKEDCWIVVDGKVYNVTEYLEEHPGGSEIIINLAGGDATREFNDIGHSINAIQLLSKYEIGICSDYTQQLIEPPSESIFQWLYKRFYPSDGKKQLRLKQREQLTNDTIRLTFSNPFQDIQCGQHIVCSNGDHSRKYTPITQTNGDLELVVKVYSNGAMSSHMNQLNVGDTLSVSGPVGENIYYGNGEFSTSNATITTNNILFICAGSGITPVYAILNAIANTDTETMYTKLLFVNTTENDIILRKELDEMSSRNSNMKQYYTITQPDAEWKGLVGRPSKEMISEIASEKRNEIVIVCGSREFNNNVSHMCLDLGYSSYNILLF